jgi:hypothetical protein
MTADWHEPEPPDYELQRDHGDDLPASVRATPAHEWWVTAALLAVAAGIVAFIAFEWPRTKTHPQEAPPPRAAAPVESPTSLGGRAEPITLPPLDESDPAVRMLVRGLSTSPAVIAWLATNGLIRNFTVAVTNIADGVTPAKHLTVLRPASGFRVVERDRQLFADPRSYDRFTPITDAIASVDPARVAALYATLKPRIEEASRDLGSPDSFDRRLERALVTLLNTPVLDQMRLKPKGIGYGYADERLEELTSAQKQLLRMGPHNARTIQASLRRIALALGIPASHLPAE